MQRRNRSSLRLKMAAASSPWDDRDNLGFASILHSQAKDMLEPGNDWLRANQITRPQINRGLSTWLNRTAHIPWDDQNRPLSSIAPSVPLSALIGGATGAIVGGLRVPLSRNRSGDTKDKILYSLLSALAGGGIGATIGGLAELPASRRTQAIQPLMDRYGLDTVGELRMAAPILMHDRRLGPAAPDIADDELQRGKLSAAAGAAGGRVVAEIRNSLAKRSARQEQAAPGEVDGQKQARVRRLQDVPIGTGPDQINAALSMFNQAKALARPEPATLSSYGLNEKQFQEVLPRLLRHTQRSPDGRMNLREFAPNPRRRSIAYGLGAGLGTGALLSRTHGIGAGIGGGLVAGGIGALVGNASANYERRRLLRTAKLLRQYGVLNSDHFKSVAPLLIDN